MIEKLSNRELEVLACLAEGNRNNEIAEKLYIAIATVENHLKRIYRKLNVDCDRKAIAYYYKNLHKSCS
ncbi:response regulator transcription factor [Caminicella sporogenes]|uniref:response regulator transcription factor n=1 Tax=Caminicella sporogenes TaxID=166485 RepID=UPI0025407C27|nr:LuxR C-terminal-related transcriptional regulator [Caminicella sporogenes]WIF95145.1 LuxR C-terminal-related transcriptional regulator [Caminicella sporogenes]